MYVNYLPRWVQRQCRSRFYELMFYCDLAVAREERARQLHEMDSKLATEIKDSRSPIAS